ncbi:hypothetical protein L7F22_067959 [Adiantum nelumboides]|nr:hypothetical protein [Adiantum nelumboides]
MAPESTKVFEEDMKKIHEDDIVIEGVQPYSPERREKTLEQLSESSQNSIDANVATLDQDGTAGLGDGLGDGMLGPAPTEEERRTLRKVPSYIPPMAFLVAFLELCERASYYGLTGPIVNYIQNPLPPGSDGGQLVGNAKVPGALGQGQSIAFAITTFNSFWAYVMPIIGAVVADTWLGRYKAICYFTVVKILAQILLTASATPAGIASGAAYPCLVVGIVLLGIGTGGIKSNVSPLIADQIKTRKAYVETLKDGTRVIRDPNATMQRLFNLFYFFINLGACTKIATVYLEKDVGFWASFLLPTCLACLMPIVLLIGNKHYIKVPPRGSILLEALRVIRLAIAKAFSWNILRFRNNLANGILDSTTGQRTSVWEFAKPATILSSLKGVDSRPKWLTWDATFVDEVQRTMRACAIFAYYPLFWLPYLMMTNNLVSQAGTLQLGGVPNDILSAFNPISIVIMLPIMDRIIYPLLRKFNLPFRPITRIFVGFMVASAAMVYAAVLQSKIYAQVPCRTQPDAANADCDSASISLWVQLPVYILIGFSEIMASVTGLEYAYQKAPARLKSVVTSLYLFTNAFASALSFALTHVSQDPYLVWLYGSIAVAAFIAGVLFFISFRKWNKFEEVENEIGRGPEREE